MSNGILTNSEKDKEVLIYLAKVNTCKTMQELDSIRKGERLITKLKTRDYVVKN